MARGKRWGATRRGAKRWASVGMMALGATVLMSSLGGCGYVYDRHGFTNSVTPWRDGQDSQEALAALTKGDLSLAESMANDGLARNPKDPYALLVLAIVYQNTGRDEAARQYYEALISMRPQATAVIGVGPNVQRRTIEDIARGNLASLGRMAPAAVTIDPTTGQVMRPPQMPQVPQSVSPQDVAFASDTNLILRFQGLHRLLDEGLITREEYDQRRAANLGSLLPYSVAQMGALGLGRAAPRPDELVNRLKAISANFEEKSISAVEHSAERDVILDALLPQKPARRADKPAPVHDDMQLAYQMSRLQRLRDAGVITDAEAAREKKVVQGQISTATAKADAAMRAASIYPDEAPPVPSAPHGAGVALGTYASEGKAEMGWQVLKERFPEQLANLQPSIKKVGTKRRGYRYQLSVGPLEGKQAAKDLCRSLKRQEISCTPTTLK